MTPKEKAKKLTLKFIHLARYEDEKTKDNMKACALLCVDESIKNLNPWKNSYMGKQQIKELQEVKQEIEKL